ncbi:hypothetical protein [Streptomyces sp. NRRL F-5650]|uniref:hypothetical protein n=1 Tax=Streptomyces sp. NRRL F-5650 TaxID=1463868 RepID=UPI00131ACB4C|nr:hypothetical protein [Streptomyces sp. NRRL F-5650]
MSELRPGDITDEMRQAVDMARRQGLQKDLRALAANIRTDAEVGTPVRAPGGRPESSGRCCGSRTPLVS